MILFPAIDLIGGKAVRLLRGDYAKATVYSSSPWEIALDFVACGCTHVHLVDLEGARDGGTPNLKTVLRIREESKAFCEIGGGIRDLKTVDAYLSAGIDRVILGTAAVTDPAFLAEAISRYGEKIAVGADFRGGKVSIRGWKEDTSLGDLDFCRKMAETGVRTLICTDIAKDGAMQGTNIALYRKLKDALPEDIRLTASGGICTVDDLLRLKEIGLYGAIIGKAYYEKTISLKEARKTVS